MKPGHTGFLMSLGELGQQTRELIEQVRTTGQPLVVTDGDRSAAVLVEAGAYEEQQRRLALLERIAAGKEDITRGNVHSQEEVEELIDQWFGTGE